MTKQLLDLVVSNPVVLLVIENGNEDVQVRQEVAQPARCSKRDGEQPARAESRHGLVEFVSGRFDRVAERFEQRTQEPFAATAGDGCKTCLQGQLGRRKLGFALASPGKGGIEPAGKHNREQRRGDVRAVVDVLVLGTALAATATDDSDRVHVEENRCRAAVVRRLRVEDCGVTERELASVHVLRVLVEQEPEVGGGPVSRSDGQEHATSR